MTTPKTLLVVDDVPEILRFFERFCATYRTSPVTLTTLDDPTKALAVVATTPFDVVITDFRMPHVSGTRVLAAARRRNPEGRRVLMTGYNEIPATEDEMRDAGINGKLKKPVRPAYLAEFLQACLSDDPRALDAMPVQEEA